MYKKNIKNLNKIYTKKKIKNRKKVELNLLKILK